MSAKTEGIADNASRLLWAGFMAILAAGVGFAVRGGIFDNWGAEYGFTGAELGAIGGAGFTGFCFGIILGGVVADKLGYGKLVIAAFALHVLSAFITFAAGPGDKEAASRVENALGEASELYLSPPRLVERSEADGRVRMRIVAGVLPSMAWLVEDNLTGRIKAAAGEDSLASEPLIYKVDQANLKRIRSLLPQEAERNLPPQADKKL